MTVGVDTDGDGHRDTEVTATAGHAFWTTTPDNDTAPGATAAIDTQIDAAPAWAIDVGEWTPASNLQAGSWLRTSTGTWTQIAAVEHHTEQARAHNLTVSGEHTYLVKTGYTDALAHNCDVAASSIPNLHGRTLSEAEGALTQGGFQFHRQTAGGYRQYRHEDGSVIWIRSNGEVQRLGPRIDPGPNQRNYSLRYDQNGSVTSAHNTGEMIQIR